MPLTRSTAARRVRNENSETTPIYRLPNEMTCEIFKHLPQEGWARHKFLTSISGTSYLWQHIALCTHCLSDSLLESIHRIMVIALEHQYAIPPPGGLSITKLMTLRALDMAHIYLERVGPAILIDLWLDLRVFPSITDSDLIVPFLLRNIHRCKSLTIQASSHNMPRLFPPPGHLYSLRNLGLRLEGGYTNITGTPHLLQPSSELHLHSLSIWGFLSLTWLNIQWESLTPDAIGSSDVAV